MKVVYIYLVPPESGAQIHPDIAFGGIPPLGQKGIMKAIQTCCIETKEHVVWPDISCMASHGLLCTMQCCNSAKLGYSRVPLQASIRESCSLTTACSVDSRPLQCYRYWHVASLAAAYCAKSPHAGGAEEWGDVQRSPRLL